MADTLWADVSEHNPPVDDSYPYHFFALRSNDGSYLDGLFDHNIAWARSRLRSGKLWGYIVYYFYRPVTDGSAILRQRVGTPDPRMAVMIDVESDEGRVSGDQSAKIGREFAALAAWLGDRRRVIGYGNVGDLDSLWPHKPEGIRLVVANYSRLPTYPGMFAHQFSSTYYVPPFGLADINSANGMDQAALETMFGFTGPPVPEEEENMQDVLALPAGVAVTLRVPHARTKLFLHADALGGVPPRVRVVWNPAWHNDGNVSPTWDTPVSLAVPAGCSQVSLSRQDTGAVPVTAAWE